MTWRDTTFLYEYTAQWWGKERVRQPALGKNRSFVVAVLLGNAVEWM